MALNNKRRRRKDILKTRDFAGFVHLLNVILINEYRLDAAKLNERKKRNGPRVNRHKCDRRHL